MGNGRAQVTFVIAQGFQRMFQFGGRGVFEQIAMSPRLQGLHDQLRIGVHGENQHLAATAEGAQAAQGVQAAGAAHGDIQQDDVRVQLHDQFGHLAAVVGFADHGIAGYI
ncbi:hypothetical protein D3C75_1140330 [compost metagenome]